MCTYDKIVPMNPSTGPTRSQISTNHRREMLLFLAQVFVSHAGITNNGSAHTDSVRFCHFWFNRPNTAKCLYGCLQGNRLRTISSSLWVIGGRGNGGRRGLTVGICHLALVKLVAAASAALPVPAGFISGRLPGRQFPAYFRILIACLTSLVEQTNSIYDTYVTLPVEMSRMDTKPLSHCGLILKGASFLRFFCFQQNPIAQPFLLHKLCSLCTFLFYFYKCH